MLNNLDLSKFYVDLFHQLENIIKFSLLISFLALFLILIKPEKSEINTIYLVFIFEIISIILSKIAIYFLADKNENIFVNKKDNITNSAIILGVHICTGLVILGVYIAQFSF